MKKNTASQVIGAQMCSTTDGSAFTGSVTVYVTGDGGTQAAGSVGSGACTHEGNGFHTYAPAQAETNYDHIGFTFIGTGARGGSLTAIDLMLTFIRPASYTPRLQFIETIQRVVARAARAPQRRQRRRQLHAQQRGLHVHGGRVNIAAFVKFQR